MRQFTEKEIQRIIKIDRYIATAKIVLVVVFVAMTIIAVSK